VCTLSFELTNDGYVVHFNRDESVHRAIAKPPQQIGNTLMPIDAEKGGSWISANAYGVCVSILNNYQAQPPVSTVKKDARSRGELVKILSTCRNKAEILQASCQINCNDYPGFQLVIFGRDFSPFSLKPSEKNDGLLVESVVNTWPVSSSSYSEDVLSYRQDYFQKHHKNDHQGFHTSHHPEKGAYSVCVHREHIQTVSLTRVTVSSIFVAMDYAAGSPCCNELKPYQRIATQELDDNYDQGIHVALA